MLVYVAAKVIYRLRDVLLIVVVAGFVAIILNPLVVALQRWHLRRGWAVAVVTLWALLVFLGLAVAFGYPLVNGLTHLADRLPTYVKQAEHGKGWIGHLIRRYHIDSWVKRNAPKLTSFAKGLAKPALSLGKGAATLVITLATIFVLVVLLLLEGAKLRVALLGFMSPGRAENYARVGREVNRSVTGYILGDLLTSIIAGLVVFVALVIVGVPFPFLWALWVALVDFLPVIGGAVAGIPTVLFATAHSLTAGIITLIVFLVYTQLENHVLNPVVMSRTVKINPLLVLLSVLVGGLHRQLDRRVLRRLRGGPARHPDRRRHPGGGAGDLAGDGATDVGSGGEPGSRGERPLVTRPQAAPRCEADLSRNRAGAAAAGSEP